MNLISFRHIAEPEVIEEAVDDDVSDRGGDEGDSSDAELSDDEIERRRTQLREKLLVKKQEVSTPDLFFLQSRPS